MKTDLGIDSIQCNPFPQEQVQEAPKVKRGVFRSIRAWFRKRKIARQRREDEKRFFPHVQKLSLPFLHCAMTHESTDKIPEKAADWLSGVMTGESVFGQESAHRRGETLGKSIYEVGRSGRERIGPQVAEKASRIEESRKDLAKNQQELESLDEQLQSQSVKPPDFEAEKEPIFIGKMLEQACAGSGTMKLKPVWAMLIVMIIASFEGVLVYLSLSPAFEGVSQIPWLMLPAQALLLVLVLFYCAHLIQDKRDRWQRWLAGISLCLLSMGLTLLRVGVLSFKSGGDPQEVMQASLESWAMVLLFFLGAIGAALLEPLPFKNAQKSCRELSKFWENETESFADLEAHRDGALAYEEKLEEFKKGEIRALITRRDALALKIAGLKEQIPLMIVEIQELIDSECRKGMSLLDDEFKHIARQLAHWKNSPEVLEEKLSRSSKLRGAVHFVPLLLCFGLLQAGCLPANTSHSSSQMNVVIDTSGSIPSRISAHIVERVQEEISIWVRQAHTGDRFVIWWFSNDGEVFPADSKSFTMPPLQVPAHVHRKQIAVQFAKQLGEDLEGLPQGIRRTPLLETLYLISTTQNSKYTILVLSDLNQDSERWDKICQRSLSSGNEEILESMLVLCPAQANTPEKISLVSWPGLIRKGSSSPYAHEKHRAQFVSFLKRWAPEAQITTSSIR